MEEILGDTLPPKHRPRFDTRISNLFQHIQGAYLIWQIQLTTSEHWD
jgi:hypothetical protein